MKIKLKAATGFRINRRRTAKTLVKDGDQRETFPLRHDIRFCKKFNLWERKFSLQWISFWLTLSCDVINWLIVIQLVVGRMHSENWSSSRRLFEKSIGFRAEN